MCGYAEEVEEDPKEYIDMTVQERLIEEEIICRSLEEDGITSSWLDTKKEWKKMVSTLQENVYTKQPKYNQISYILPNNNMAGIATRYVTENELNIEMSIEELSNHALALDIFLMDKQTAGRKKGGALSNAPNASKTPDNTQEAEPDAVNICQILPKETIRNLA
ncbi:hypothetical protein RhiirA1_475014 [Rhizophagus irregularis]|uniref:Uncharacterized protein n=1 Tax=Rhizophagus irregularis TaxID=588596 RepID=A0A2N0QXK4_9GLOM|nr:hypothetical protein RhiirA1_475014 [Rhizophagus irregularis]